MTIKYNITQHPTHNLQNRGTPMTIYQIQKRNLQINHTKLLQCNDNIPNTKTEKKQLNGMLLVVFFNLRQQNKSV